MKLKINDNIPDVEVFQLINNEPEIIKIKKIFKDKNCSFELMHCVSTYPMDTADANLVTINDLKKIYKCNVGYSGHENGVVVSLSALQFNISSLEILKFNSLANTTFAPTIFA